MNRSLNIIAAALSDQGRVRDSNEDRAFYCKFDTAGQTGMGLLAAVADGMGGHAAGEAASERAIQVVQSVFRSAAASSDESTDWTAVMKEAVLQANAEVFEESRRWQGRSGMGTTLTAAAIVGEKLYLGHAGDSRAYIIHGGGISQATEDDTWTAEQVRKGLMTPEQAQSSDKAGQLTKALGIKPEVTPSIQTFELSPGDVILLCSDGLTGVVYEEDIKKTLAGLKSPQAACQRLVRLANKRGGPDNIAVVVLSFSPRSAPLRAPRRSRRKMMIAGLAAVLALLAIDIAYLASEYSQTPTPRPKVRRTATHYDSPVTITVKPVTPPPKPVPKPQPAPAPEPVPQEKPAEEPLADVDVKAKHAEKKPERSPNANTGPGLVMRDMSGRAVTLSEGGAKR